MVGWMATAADELELAGSSATALPWLASEQAASRAGCTPRGFDASEFGVEQVQAYADQGCGDHDYQCDGDNPERLI